jgi:hypothetical protein
LISRLNKLTLSPWYSNSSLYVLGLVIGLLSSFRFRLIDFNFERNAGLVGVLLQRINDLRFSLNGRDGSEIDETYTGSNGSLSLVNMGRRSMLLLFLSPGDYMFF